MRVPRFGLVASLELGDGIASDVRIATNLRPQLCLIELLAACADDVLPAGTATYQPFLDEHLDHILKDRPVVDAAAFVVCPADREVECSLGIRIATCRLHDA